MQTSTVFLRVTLLALLVSAFVGVPAGVAEENQVRGETAAESMARLLSQVEPQIKAIYETDEFRMRSFEATWLPDGSGYLKLETPDGESGPEIARYDSASGHRSVVVAREKLLVPGTAERLSIHGFVGSPTGKRFLLHTDEAGGTDRWLYVFSPNSRWAFHTWSTFDKPPVTDLVELPEHRSVRMLEDNAAAAARVKPLIVRPTEFLQLDIGDGVVMDAWMIKPRDFDPTKKYPVFVFVYGEPADQTVLDDWRGGQGFSLFHRAVADLGYLVVSIENRGTPGPGGRRGDGRCLAASGRSRPTSRPPV